MVVTKICRTPPLPFSSHSHSSHSKTSRSPVPFSLRGGAPCILPPPPTENVISLNSDDESGGRVQYGRHLHTAHGSNSPKHSAQTTSLCSSDTLTSAPMASTPPTSVCNNAESSASGSRRSVAKGKRTQASPAISASERLVMQADDLITKGASMAESSRDDRAHRRDAHYQNKEAE